MSLQDHKEQEVARIKKLFKQIEGHAQTGATFMEINGLKNDDSFYSLKRIVENAKEIDVNFYNNMFPVCQKKGGKS